MSDYLYLARQYLLHHRLTTGILIGSITLILFLPATLQALVESVERHFRFRADSTPLVIGPRGSALDLVLACVYFDKPSGQMMRWEQLRRVEEQQLATVIPLLTGLSAADYQIVGIDANYLQLRRLHLRKVRLWNMLGECVVGASAAKRLGVQLGDTIPVAASSAFILGDKPLRLRVVGLLATMESADDDVIFTDVESCRVAAGLGHGHASNIEHGSVAESPYTDITEENVGDFHFHGDRGKFPKTAMIVIPENDKAETILMGQYFSPDETVQIVQPREVVDALLTKVMKVRGYLLAAVALVNLVTFALMLLVAALSVRLRQPVLITMWKLGCSQHAIAALLTCQMALVLAASLGLAALMALASRHYGTDLIRNVLL